jgi:hypothetical protein
MGGKSGPGRPVWTCTIGAMVSRICEIFSASSGFRKDNGILDSCLCAMLDSGLFALLIPLVFLMRWLGIRSFRCRFSVWASFC